MGHEIDVESVDLAELSAFLRARCDGRQLEGFVSGRTTLRDAVLERLDCSQLAAECIVDTMVSRGMVRFERRAGEPECWRVVA